VIKERTKNSKSNGNIVKRVIMFGITAFIISFVTIGWVMSVTWVPYVQQRSSPSTILVPYGYKYYCLATFQIPQEFELSYLDIKTFQLDTWRENIFTILPNFKEMMVKFILDVLHLAFEYCPKLL